MFEDFYGRHWWIVAIVVIICYTAFKIAQLSH